MVVGAKHRDNNVIHVTGLRTVEIRGIDKVEGNGFTVRRSTGLHAWLVSDGAVMREEQAVGSVEVNHRNHVFSVAQYLAHQRGSPSRHSVANLDRFAFRAFPFP